jgi:hypothetical protein
MAGMKEAKQKAGPSGQKEKNRKETEDPTGAKGISEDAGRRPAQDMQRREAHKDLKDRGELKKPSMTKRRQARKMATMVKRLKRNPEDGESQPPIEGEADLASGDGWDAQQQATVTAYAQSRGMQPREVLQALVNSMEKTLRKEKVGNPASQVPPFSTKQKGEAAGKVETGPSPGRGGRDQREKKPDGNCIACHRDKRRSIPPKTRWKEEQKERARSMGSAGKENLAAEVREKITATTGLEENEAQQALEGARAEVAVTPGPEEAATEGKSKEGSTQQAPGGALEGARGPKKEEAPAPVA